MGGKCRLSASKGKPLRVGVLRLNALLDKFDIVDDTYNHSCYLSLLTLAGDRRLSELLNSWARRQLY